MSARMKNALFIPVVIGATIGIVLAANMLIAGPAPGRPSIVSTAR